MAVRRRLASFWKQYRRSRVGMAGLAMLVFFCALAILAPYITPYDPYEDKNLAGYFAMPEWLATLQGLNVSRNVEVFDDFSGGASFRVSCPDYVSYAVENGTLIIAFDRAKGPPLGDFNVDVWTDFDYHYAPPDFFDGSARWRATLANNVKYKVSFILAKPDGTAVTLWDSSWFNPKTQDFQYRLDPQTGKLFLVSSEDNWYSGPIDWTEPLPPLHSRGGPYVRIAVTGKLVALVTPVLFDEPGTYRFIMRLTVADRSDAPSALRFSVDRVRFKLYGKAFGILGTDEFGRDLFSQLIYGSRMSLMVGFLAAVVSVTLGLVVGMVSGYFRGVVDEVLMRLNDWLLVLPGLPLLLVLIAVLGPSLTSIVIVIGFLGFMGIARVIRSQTMSLRERPFIMAARAAGASSWRIIFRHILPNVAPLAFAYLALSVPSAIVAEAALSWLGLGDPRVPTWGQMLFRAHYHYVIYEWWWIVFPGLCIALVSVAFIFVGHAMDEILNPRLRRR